MFFLKAYTQDGLIILHVKGCTDGTDLGFVNGEGIFEVEQTEANTMNVVRQVGEVQIIDGQLMFNYTDDDFKKSINYNEKNGYSSLDGGLWEVHKTSYLNSNGKTREVMNPNKLMHFMYSGAKNPFMQLPNFATLFSHTDKRRENNRRAATERRNRKPKCAIL